MLLISFLSQKGGVGKSTLARLVATHFAYAEWKVKIADFDVGQKTATDWCALRLEAGFEPEIPVEPVSRMRSVLDWQGYDLIVLDGKPHSDRLTLEIARHAHLNVLPVGVSRDDLVPTVRLAHELVSHDIAANKILFVLNRVGASEIEENDARNFIDMAGYTVAKNFLPERVIFRVAQNTGRAACEVSPRRLVDASSSLAEEIVTRMMEVTNV